ncbi:MAG: TRAP transporter fused permease subunit [Acidobacteriota bacterium]
MKTSGATFPLPLQILGAGLCLFTIAEVNYPYLSPIGQLSIFLGVGLALAFLTRPLSPRFADAPWSRWLDRVLAAASLGCCLYLLVQSEPLFRSWWIDGRSLGERAGLETNLDLAIGTLGLFLVLEATRRTIGLALPILSVAFLAYAFWGSHLPNALFPHRGYDFDRIVGQTVLHSQGVLGTALRVMFTYVLLFVIFGVLLQATGAIGFILRSTRRLFHNSPGGAAKVAVLSSGLMGSLSGSAVANTATTGTFTIPMMRSSGFDKETAAGVEAAASSGGALVPPVMGAGAYMMLEIIDPPVTYLEILRAALIPALLYYLSLFLIVHFRSRRLSTETSDTAGTTGGGSEGDTATPAAPSFGGWIFLGGFAVLLVFLLSGFTVFRAVSLALAAVVLLAALQPATRLGLGQLASALAKAARDMTPLICAAACVGIILGVVTLTGVGTRLPAAILPLAQENLLLALGALMVSSIVLGMGLPSAVCYLLLATLVGPALGDLGVVPLAAHLFIFYFGMMSMVTPPVALAAYTAASIAGSGILRTAFAAFRFALVGFTLPYMFVLRPELLMLDESGETAGWLAVLLATAVAVAGIIPFAAAISGYFRGPLGWGLRATLFAASGLLLIPGPSAALVGLEVPLLAPLGLVLLAATALLQARRRAEPNSLDAA